MSSANGYTLEVKVGAAVHSLNASWAAPFFVLSVCEWEPEDRPLLYHASSIDDAREAAKTLPGRVSILDSKFQAA